MKHKIYRKKLGTGAAHIILIIACVISLFPIMLLILASFKPEHLIFRMENLFIFEPSLEHYVFVFEHGFLGNLINSVILTLSSMFFAVLMGIFAAFALVSYRIKRKKDIVFWIVSQRMLPPIAIVIPFFMIMKNIGLAGTHLGLLIMYTLFDLPLAIWLLRGFFVDIPKEIFESARIDGCSEIFIVLKILVPVAIGGIVSTALICIIFTWSEFLFALILGGRGVWTAPVIVALYKTQWGAGWARVFSTGTIVILPIIFLVSVMGTRLRRGLTFGAIK